MAPDPIPPDAAAPFDRRRRRARRDRAAGRIEAHGFLADHIAAELLERLETVSRDFSSALVLGACPLLSGSLAARGLAVVTLDAGFALACAAGGVQGDEDRLPFADASFDLVISAGVLDGVNDLPGALVLARRTLKPDGLFLAGFAGAGSLPRLRAAMLAADMAGGGASPRIHPQVDVRSGGDLLGRAGFTLQVADGERLEIRYDGLAPLLADLRFSGSAGALSGTPAPLTREQMAIAHIHFADQADADGRIGETIEIVYLIGWAPDPSQPRPAKRGSATTSLAAALTPRTRTPDT